MLSLLNFKMKLGRVLMALVLIAILLGVVRLVLHIVKGWD